MLTLITYGSKSIRSSLGDTAPPPPLKDSPLFPSCIKFQKSSAPRENSTYKFSILQPPIIREEGGGGSYSCFGDFNIHHKDWLTYSDGTSDLVNFFSSYYLFYSGFPSTGKY